MNQPIDLETALRRHYRRLDPGAPPAALSGRVASALASGSALAGRGRAGLAGESAAGRTRLGRSRLGRSWLGGFWLGRSGLDGRARARRVAVIGLTAATLVLVIAVSARPPGGSLPVGGAVTPTATPIPTATPAEGPSATPSPTSDGRIPETVDGGRVFTGPAIDVHIAGAVGSEPFLIGGWLTYVLADCPVSHDFPETPLLAPCNDGFQLLNAKPVDPHTEPTSPFGRRLVVDGGPGAFQASLGQPIVVRVHVHDPRAAACPSAYRAACEAAIVVEGPVWRDSIAPGGIVTTPPPAG